MLPTACIDLNKRPRSRRVVSVEVSTRQVGFAVSCIVDNVSCLVNLPEAWLIVLLCFCGGLLPLCGFGAI